MSLRSALEPVDMLVMGSMLGDPFYRSQFAFPQLCASRREKKRLPPEAPRPRKALQLLSEEGLRRVRTVKYAKVW